MASILFAMNLENFIIDSIDKLFDARSIDSI